MVAAVGEELARFGEARRAGVAEEFVVELEWLDTRLQHAAEDGNLMPKVMAKVIDRQITTDPTMVGSDR